ncbi:hydantoinase B/oxoprolinase family protein [Methylocaldum szegediense]|uniref:5-oxoprolinase (ATP-hydrolysing) n=1 Tax=Methylocaldum szegediense TaxID=73780 RepID=A0ABM9I7U9_9GAMM|nr:hydantoinase B/oxoprolinase family protein [Methylocaldum szegediense]CAI8946442.1 5-oxoprolinase (ATP-hydrolysing) [Methylocaldum szegediense]
MHSKSWQFWIDRGGTFTDIVARRSDGLLLTHKLLSENPDRYRDAALQGIRDVLGLAPDAPLGDANIELVRMGTTVGTNALLERKGEPTVLAITRGFADALRIGHQNRPDIFALNIRRPEPLYQKVVEITGRIDAHGSEVEPLDLTEAERRLHEAYRDGFRSLAVVLMHAWRKPDHELELEKLAKAIGFTQVSLSHRVSPAMKLIGRGDITVADAYLSPALRRYIDQVEAGLGTEPNGKMPEGQKRKLLFMQSNGGLADARRFQGKDCILSGPAGGIVGAVAVSRLAGFDRIVTFDMGGTSTDVAHYAGEFERSQESEIAGVRLRAPILNIHTVAAGGGSILHFDGLRFRVGPDSAGANPGPACYRRGGPLCVTDANVMVGKIRPEFFPHVFGPNGNEALDTEIVRRKFRELAETIRSDSGRALSSEEVAEGFIDVAVENMAAAIKTISVQRGHDLADYVLCCFGAAGGQHACKVAERLGIGKIFLHPLAGVLSAYGMGLADYRVVKERAIAERLNDAAILVLRAKLDDLEAEGRAELSAQDVPPERIVATRQAMLRYEGTDTLFAVPLGDSVEMRTVFEERHRQRFGFVYSDKALLVETAAVELIGLNEPVEEPVLPLEPETTPVPIARVPMYSGRSHHDTPVYRREDLKPGVRLQGPAILIEPNSTTIIEPGWQGEITARNHLILSAHEAIDRADSPPETEAKEQPLDPARLEIFNRLFMSVAEDMGYTLQNTAHSVNIKERLDFSCALFDGNGELVANAPHIPVHLGSMDESVKALIARHGDKLRPGDVWLINSPYHGGTHLPDITVITPLFDDAGESVLFYLASRGHHADVGGITPGSMPPRSTSIDQEGVLSSGLKIVENGRLLESAIRDWLNANPYPARDPDRNLSDLRAQIAANVKGVQALRGMLARYSLATVQCYMRYVQDNAEEAVRRVIARLCDGEFEVPLDSGAVIRVAIRVDKEKRQASIDFSGTSPQQPDNLNAPAAVCKAAVLYVFRTLVDDDIPLNAGCLRPLDIRIPEGSLLNPRYPAAVAAGNVETSQHIVDAVYGALGVLAASQGTMNNFTFGNTRYQYYETICGGAGAGAGFDGADAVHTHMTNSCITDPEVLEWRFPVRLETFAIRRGSGGEGLYKGGDGVIRKIRFLEPMTAGIVSSRRLQPPFGLAGGNPGACGRNLVIRRNGAVEILGSQAETDMAEGDVFVIETPGGGGYGSSMEPGPTDSGSRKTAN